MCEIRLAFRGAKLRSSAGVPSRTRGVSHVYILLSIAGGGGAFCVCDVVCAHPHRCLGSAVVAPLSVAFKHGHRLQSKAAAKVSTGARRGWRLRAECGVRAAQPFVLIKVQTSCNKSHAGQCREAAALSCNAGTELEQD